MGLRSSRIIGVTVASLLAAGALTVLTAAPASADGAGQPFSCTTATDLFTFDPSTSSQVTYSQVDPDSSAVSSYTALSSNARVPVNAVGFDPVDHYLYGFQLSATVATLVKIDSAGTETVLGPVTGIPNGRAINKGGFDPSGVFWAAAGNSVWSVNVTTRVATTHALANNASIDGISDFTYAYGYFWGAADGQFYRYNPTTNGLSLLSSPVAEYGDSAFTYANGDLGFGYAGSFVQRVRINNPTASSPTFTQIDVGGSAYPAVGDGSDASSCVQTTAISTTSLPTGTSGQSYSAQLAATGGATPASYSWAVTGGALPDGLSLDPATGLISGNPSGSGTADLTVTVTANGAFPTTASQSLSISIVNPVSVTTTSLPDATYGQTYSAQLSATGGSGSYTWNLTGLPAGLSVDPATGLITGTPTTSGTANVSVQAADSANPSATASTSLNLTANPAPLTVTVTGAQTYGGSPTFSIANYSGFVNGDNASVVSGSLTGCSTTVTSGAPVGSYPGTTTGCSGLTSPNYQITYTDGGFSVGAASLTATVVGTQSYGGPPSFTVSGYSGFVNGDSAAGVSGNLTGCTTSTPSGDGVGSYAGTISGCAGLSDANYTVNYADGGFTVTPSPLTITASSTTTSYGASTPIITASYAGFVNGDNASSLTTPPRCTTGVTATMPVGNYASSCTGAVDPNYAISYVDGSVTVGKAPLTITASSAAVSYGSSAPTISAGYSGFVNGEGPAVLTAQPTCTSGYTSASGVGSYSSSCSGAAATNYAIGYQAGTVTVTPAAVTATYTGPVQVAAGSSLVPSATLASPAAACQANQPLSFSLDVNPTTGAAGPYPLESAVTNSAGLATGAAIKTTGWQSGAYNVTASSTGTANCQAATTSSALAITPASTAGQVAAGAGTYPVAGAGTVNFAFVVGLLPKTTNKYLGAVSVVNNGRWWFTGALTSYTKTGSVGTAKGSGNLYGWNPSLNHNRGGWQLTKTGVTVTATFTATTKTAAGTFGVQVGYTPTTGQPSLPNSSPTALRAGVILVY